MFGRHMSSGRALRDRLKSGSSVEAVGGKGIAISVEARAVVADEGGWDVRGARCMQPGAGGHEELCMRSSGGSMQGKQWSARASGADGSSSPPLPHPSPPAPAPVPVIPSELRSSLADAPERRKEAWWEDELGFERGKVGGGPVPESSRGGREEWQHAQGAGRNEVGNSGQPWERGRGSAEERWGLNNFSPSQRRASDEHKDKSFSSALLSARSHLVATPVSSARSSVFGGEGAGEAADRGGGRDSSIRRSAHYTRPSTP